MGEYFPGTRADDLFFKSNSDGDDTISCEEFINIYLKEIDFNAEKRLKYVENMVRLRGRFEKGICSFATRFFRKDDPKKIASKKELDKY